MRLVVSVSLVALYVAASAWVGWWVMEPINRSAGPFRGLRQFQIADVVSLMLLLQIALAISAGLIALNRESENWPTFVLVVITVGPAFILWWAGMSIISRAAIQGVVKRVAVVVVLMPVAMVLMVALPGAAAALLLSGFVEEVDFAVALVGFVLLVCVGVTARRIASWAISRPAALSQRLVEQHGRRGREVETIDLSQHRQADGSDSLGSP